MSLCPEGTYKAVAVPIDIEGEGVVAQFGASSKGTKQVVLHFEIIEGHESGRRLAWIGFFTKDAVARTLQSLRYAGMKGDDLMKLTGSNPQKLDNVVDIVVGHEEYNGKTSAKIQWVNQPGGGGLKLKAQFDDKEMRMFAAKMKATVKGVPEVAGQKAGQAPTPPDDDNDGTPPSDDDSDVPF